MIRFQHFICSKTDCWGKKQIYEAWVTRQSLLNDWGFDEICRDEKKDNKIPVFISAHEDVEYDEGIIKDVEVFLKPPDECFVGFLFDTVTFPVTSIKIRDLFEFFKEQIEIEEAEWIAGNTLFYAYVAGKLRYSRSAEREEVLRII